MNENMILLQLIALKIGFIINIGGKKNTRFL